jgi:hypothetical protein
MKRIHTTTLLALGAVLLSLGGAVGCSPAPVMHPRAAAPTLRPVAVELPGSATSCAGELCFTYVDDSVR